MKMKTALQNAVQRVLCNASGMYACPHSNAEKTFIYFDPPYRPITNTASFTAYTENLFNDDKQIELVKFVDEMNKKGVLL